MSGEGWRMEGANTVKLKCGNCGNTTDHFVYITHSGPQVGCALFWRHSVGGRKHYLVCPTCNTAAKELTSEQANAMKGTT
jgi:hypothetical protein